MSVLKVSHLVMATFGLVSIQNIATYFVSAGHGVGAAWTLGTALGLALLTISIMLTHIDRQNDRAAFWWLLLCGTVLAGVSGGIQSAEYAKHLEQWAAMGLGYLLPIAGEILLAVATASYVSAKKQQKLRLAATGANERIAECVADALSDVDVSKVRKYVERRIDGIVRAQIDVVAAELTPSLTPLSPTAAPSAETDDNQQFGPQNLPLAQEKRAVQVAKQSAERKEAVLALLDEQGPLGTSAIATALGIHRDTARKTCQQLRKEGTLKTVGRKWQRLNDLS